MDTRTAATRYLQITSTPADLSVSDSGPTLLLHSGDFMLCTLQVRRSIGKYDYIIPTLKLL